MPEALPPGPMSGPSRPSYGTPPLFRNTLWNLLGEGLPMAAALLSIPWLISSVGMERFGALTLIWALLGYLSVLDLGLVRSLIQTIAERFGRTGDAQGAAGGAAGGVAGIAGPALGAMGLVGLVTGGIVALAAGFIAHRFVLGSAAVTEEVRDGIMVAAAIVPIALVSAGFRGVLEAHQRFRAVNLVRMAVGVLNYLSPLCVLPFTQNLVPVIAAIAVGRLVGMVAYGWLCVRLIPDLPFPRRYGREPLRGLFTMGAWMMLNNLIGPAMLYADRFILMSLVPVGVVAFYTTPFEILSRLLLIPAALSAALFPLAASLFRRNPAALGRILETGGQATLVVFLAVQAAVELGGGTALSLWLGPEFAQGSTLVLSTLTLGVLFNAAAYVPYALIQSVGRVDVTAKLQLVELPVYLALLWVLADRYGPAGAAAAWSLRTAADCFLLLALLPRYAPATARAARNLALAAGFAGILGICGLLFDGWPDVGLALVGLAGAVWLGARHLLHRTGGRLPSLPRSGARAGARAGARSRALVGNDLIGRAAID